MKRKLFLVLGLSLVVNTAVWAQDKLYGMFDGRTPCKELSSQLEEKPREACTKIKWRLALYRDSLTGEPTIYKLVGFMFKRDAPRTGSWKITKGTAADTDAVVFELLLPGKPSILLMGDDPNVLFFLNAERKLYVGNRDFSYALNRVNKRILQ